MDVIFKEGMLYLQGVKFGKRTWRKTWMVLFEPSSSGIGRLELYSVRDTCSDATSQNKKPSQRKLAERRVVRLSDCLSITPAPEESCPLGCRALYLNTTQCTYTLASTTCQDWLSALCSLAFQKDPGELDKGAVERGNGLPMEDNDLYSSWKADLTLPPGQYYVTVQTTEASSRCKLSGEYLFSPDREAVLLLDVRTGLIIYHWPYRFLRRFGQVKGGFSIEAGHRCDSGEGLFTFLSKHGLQIFQAIAKQCLVEKEAKDASVQSPNLHVRSLSDHSPDKPAVQLPTTTFWPSDPPVCGPPGIPADREVESTSELYATINHSSAPGIGHSSLVRPDLTSSMEAEEEEGEDEDGWCRSLEGINQDDGEEDSVYSNLNRWMPTEMKDQTEPEGDVSECIYSVVKTHETPSQLQPQPLSQAFPQPQALSFSPPKPRYQPQPQPPPLVKNQIQPWFQPQEPYKAQAQAVEEMKGVQEARSRSPSVAPTEIPVSFKQRLSEIISKDLAKLQSPLPSGRSSPPVSHY
ncbi:docking protein 3 [Centroberyx gerrardi]